MNYVSPYVAEAARKALDSRASRLEDTAAKLVANCHPFASIYGESQHYKEQMVYVRREHFLALKAALQAEGGSK